MICKFLGGLLMKKYDTRQRDSLLDFLNQHPDQSLSVRQIAQALCARQISLSAVYRNLSQLEAEGLIARTVYGDIQPRVEYSLTELGRAFGPVLDSIRAFGQVYISHMGPGELPR